MIERDCYYILAWICKIEGKEIIKLAELHLRYSKNSYHSSLTVYKPHARVTITLAAASKQFATEMPNVKYHMPNCQVQWVNMEMKSQRCCEVIQEKHTREMGNLKETGKRSIWH